MSQLQRRQVAAEVLSERADALVVAGLGTPVWDAAAAGDVAENLYLWGSMGLAVPVGLGLALARPERRVLVMTGDGEMLMGVGSLAVVAAEAPRNLAILVLDNESFAETGGQTGLTAGKADIAAMARGAGLAETQTVRDVGAVRELAGYLFRTPGPVLAVAKVAPGEDELVLPSRDGRAIGDRFRGALEDPAKR